LTGKTPEKQPGNVRGGMSIWKEWHGVSTERRKQITTRIEVSFGVQF